MDVRIIVSSSAHGWSRKGREAKQHLRWAHAHYSVRLFSTASVSKYACWSAPPSQAPCEGSRAVSRRAQDGRLQPSLQWAMARSIQRLRLNTMLLLSNKLRPSLLVRTRASGGRLGKG